MLAHALYDAFRSDVTDTVKPYLWTDSEVWRYLNDAYTMFARLTGGIADRSSDATRVPLTAGEATSEVSRSILRLREAWLVSSGERLKIVNHTDLDLLRASDYGRLAALPQDHPGPVRYLVVGEQAGLLRWVQVPEVDDEVRLLIYRLPLTPITGPDQDLCEVDEQHHEHLLLWMKARAYGKQDADTFDKGRRDQYQIEFQNYCSFAGQEWERSKTKVRTVSYGGL